MTQASVKAACELRDTLRAQLEHVFARSSRLGQVREISAADSFGLSIIIDNEYLELHIYANLEPSP